MPRPQNKISVACPTTFPFHLFFCHALPLARTVAISRTTQVREVATACSGRVASGTRAVVK
jgi:hypothetical protein